MDEQVAQLDVRVAQVGPEQGFAVEIEEHPAQRMVGEELAALVTRAVEFDVAALHVVFQRLEERRQQILRVPLGRIGYLTAEIMPSAVAQLDHAGYPQQQVLGKGLARLDCGEQRDGKTGLLDSACHLGQRAQGGNRGSDVRKVGRKNIDLPIFSQKQAVKRWINRDFKQRHQISAFFC